MRAATTGSLILAAALVAPCVRGASMDPGILSDYALRFRGIKLLYGEAALGRFSRSHVAVVGLGGVGSWAAEAIARTGFGTITLVDMDDACISNTNRQVHSVAGVVGQPKVEVMGRRIEDINPECDVRRIADWVTPENADGFLDTALPRIDAVIDCIGLPDDKSPLVDACVRRGIFVVTTGTPGDRRDPTAVQAIDLAQVTTDPVLVRVRDKLRKTHGWPAEVEGQRPSKAAFGVKAVSSTEEPENEDPDDADTFRGDFCGTAAFVTGTYGFAAASVVADALSRDEDDEDGTATGEWYAKLRSRMN